MQWCWTCRLFAFFFLLFDIFLAQLIGLLCLLWLVCMHDLSTTRKLSLLHFAVFYLPQMMKCQFFWAQLFDMCAWSEHKHKFVLWYYTFLSSVTLSASSSQDAQEAAISEPGRAKDLLCFIRMTGATTQLRLLICSYLPSVGLLQFCDH
jgi:hypothetical protein